MLRYLLLLLILLVAGCEDLQSRNVTLADATATVRGLQPAENGPIAETSARTSPIAPTVTHESTTAIATATQSPGQATGTPQPLPTGTPTPATPTPDPASFGQDEKYQLYVSYSLEPDAAPESDNQPADEKYVIVVATLANNGERPIEVTRESLTLVGSDGRTYGADDPDADTEPPLVGLSLTPGESFLGLVRFAIPQEVTAEALRWCPEEPEDCSHLLQAPVP